MRKKLHPYFENYSISTRMDRYEIEKMRKHEILKTKFEKINYTPAGIFNCKLC